MSQPRLFSSSRLAAFFLLGLFALGCASGAKAERAAKNERVAGQPPSAADAGAGQLPRGPDILVGQARPGEPAVAPSSGEPPGPQDAVITRAALQQLIQKGPSFPLSMVEVEAARSQGKFVGYRVLNMTPAAQEALQGRLMPGDIITHLNGVRVERPDDYLNAWKLLPDISALRIDFVRADAPTHVVWRVH